MPRDCVWVSGLPLKGFFLLSGNFPSFCPGLPALALAGMQSGASLCRLAVPLYSQRALQVDTQADRGAR